MRCLWLMAILTCCYLLALVGGPRVPAIAQGGAGVDLARFEGFTRPSEQLLLESYLDGVLEKLHVKDGDRFKADDVLVSLDDDIQAKTVELAQLRAESMAEVRIAEARVAEAQVELESQEELARNSSATPRDVRRAKAGLDIANAELEQAQDNRKLAAVQHQIEQERLHLHTLRAPFDGEVIRVAIEEGAGDGAALRQNDAIMHLAKLDPILADISLPEAVVDQLEIDRVYQLGVGRRGKTVNARLSRIASVADRGSQLIEVEFEITNPDGALRSGVRCRLLATAPVNPAASQ